LLLQLCKQLAGAIGSAGRARRTYGTVIETDKDMMLENGQKEILLISE
jgi:hypothetical protein